MVIDDFTPGWGGTLVTVLRLSILAKLGLDWRIIATVLSVAVDCPPVYMSIVHWIVLSVNPQNELCSRLGGLPP